MTPTHIVVLEDTHERVAWLRETFPGVEIQHCTNVVDFMKHTRTPCALIILDHDLAGELGRSPEAKAIYDRGEAADLHGLTGMDAVRVCDTHTPVVVWSANPVWGPNMRNLLDERGVPHVYYPFKADANMAGIIRDAYHSKTGVWV